MKMLPIVAALLLASGTAFAQSIGEKSGASAALGISPSTSDFVQQAAISDMFEIQSSELAAKRTEGKTKEFAERMVKAHNKTTDELKGLVQGKKVDATLPTKMDDAHQQMLDKLQGLKGGEFARQYREDQVEAHENAVSLFRRYAEGGDNATLKDWAGKTLPTLEKHLEMAQQLKE